MAAGANNVGPSGGSSYSDPIRAVSGKAPEPGKNMTSSLYSPGPTPSSSTATRTDQAYQALSQSWSGLARISGDQPFSPIQQPASNYASPLQVARPTAVASSPGASTLAPFRSPFDPIRAVSGRAPGQEKNMTASYSAGPFVSSFTAFKTTQARDLSQSWSASSSQYASPLQIARQAAAASSSGTSTTAPYPSAYKTASVTLAPHASSSQHSPFVPQPSSVAAATSMKAPSAHRIDSGSSLPQQQTLSVTDFPRPYNQKPETKRKIEQIVAGALNRGMLPVQVLRPLNEYTQRECRAPIQILYSMRDGDPALRMSLDDCRQFTSPTPIHLLFLGDQDRSPRAPSPLRAPQGTSSTSALSNLAPAQLSSLPSQEELDMKANALLSELRSSQTFSHSTPTTPRASSALTSAPMGSQSMILPPHSPRSDSPNSMISSVDSLSSSISSGIPTPVRSPSPATPVNASTASDLASGSSSVESTIMEEVE